MDGTIRVITRSEVRRALDWPTVLPAVERALVALDGAAADSASSSHLRAPGASLHLKAGLDPDTAMISVKANLRGERGGMSGGILLFDGREQRLSALVASADLTAIRTAAVAAVCARRLAAGQRDVAILGAGPVAAFTEEALRFLGAIRTLRVWSRSLERSTALVEGSGVSAGTAVPSVCEAVRGADVIVTATPSRMPILTEEDLDSGSEGRQVILALGADTAGKRELGDGVLDDAQLYADSVPDALRVGESAHLDPQHQRTIVPIAPLLADPSLPIPGTRVVMDSVGSSIVDAAVLAVVMANLDVRSGTVVALDA